MRIDYKPFIKLLNYTKLLMKIQNSINKKIPHDTHSQQVLKDN